MVICVEGCPGVGKSTLVRRFAEHMPCVPCYEEISVNPFLLDFYQNPKQYAVHMQYTFLLLQERQFRVARTQEKKHEAVVYPLEEVARADLAGKQMMIQSETASTVVCDFHPFKSRVFASIFLSPDMQTLLMHLYRSLRIPQPDLVVYLRADEHTLLARLRKRHEMYQEPIDISSVTRMCSAYDTFFRTYPGPVITIDTTHIDYVHNPQEVSVLLQQIPFLFVSQEPGAHPFSC